MVKATETTRRLMKKLHGPETYEMRGGEIMSDISKLQNLARILEDATAEEMWETMTSSPARDFNWMDVAARVLHTMGSK